MKPSLMARARVWPGGFIDGQAVVDVMPIVRCYVSRIDAERFHNVDSLKYAINI
jgi:hypothetical protein